MSIQRSALPRTCRPPGAHTLVVTRAEPAWRRSAHRMRSANWLAGTMATAIWATLAALPAGAAQAQAAASAASTAATAAAGPATAANSATTSDLNKGEVFYAKVCGRCHETGIGPVLRGRGMPAAFYIAFARNGMNAMPAFRVTDVDDETLAAVAEWLSGSAAPTTEPKR